MPFLNTSFELLAPIVGARLAELVEADYHSVRGNNGKPGIIIVFVLVQ